MRSGAAAGWTISCASRRSTCGSNTTPSSARAQVRVPIDHPDPAHLLVSGTGITHLGSANARDAMHPGRTAGAERTGDSDSMRMFRMGVEGGKPAAGKIGVQPEWFYKGDGSIIVPPGTPLTMPAFAVTGGEEAEIVGVYVVDDHGTPRRIGFVLGNEFSDHGLEEQNYLYAAHSKLRECSMGPELLLGDLPDSVRGLSRVLRGGETLWKGDFQSGENHMSHSIANLEHHHFKYAMFRRPGFVHCHFFGAAVLSYADGRARGARRRVQARRAGVRPAAAQHAAPRRARSRRGRAFVGLRGCTWAGGRR